MSPVDPLEPSQTGFLMIKWPWMASKTASKLCLRPIPESAWKNINFDTHNLTLASNGLKWPQEASIGLQWPHFFSPFWPQKYAHENRGVKRASHVKYELNLWSRTPSNRLLKDKTASNGLINSLKVLFETHFKLCMKNMAYFLLHFNI